MPHLLKNLLLISLLVGLSAVAHAASVQGVLMDKMCSYKAETRIVPGDKLEGGMLVAYVHTRHCALMPDCQKSGYGVYTYDDKFLLFDEAGNRKALALLKETKKEDDLRVEVTGEIQGDTIKVASIKLQ
ncbi:MAG TPA: hypothetical protein VN841_13655 [Bryobacteraceae bacterium]|nr:hypothetical protein [Bryobacteraceae bacterium]